MKTLGQILSCKHNILPKLVDKAQQLSKFDRLFRSFFDAALARHCHLAELTATEAVVVADSSAWAMRLRYAIPDILKNVKTQPEFKELKKIRYCVSIDQSLPQPKQAKHCFLKAYLDFQTLLFSYYAVNHDIKHE